MEIIQEITRFELSSNVRNSNVGNSHYHWHDNYELCYLEEKPCDFWIDGELIHAQKNDLVAIQERIIHRFMPKSDNTPVFIMQFRPQILLNSNLTIKPLKKHILAKEISKIPWLKEKILKLLEIAKSEKNASETKDNLFFQSLASALYFLLMRHFSTNEDVSSLKKDRLECYRVIEYINNNFKDKIDITRISSALYIPERRLSSLFLKYTGIELNDYINLLRIKNANKLLIDGHSVADAALDSGFQCIRTFNNIYKKVMEMTPSEYIKKPFDNP